MPKFAKWTPDLSDFDGSNEVKNCLPVDNDYTEFLQLVTSDDALASDARGAAHVFNFDGTPSIYAGTSTNLYWKTGGSWSSLGSGFVLPSRGYWRFSQFGRFIAAVAANQTPQIATIGGGDFADIENAPKAKQVGVIRDFLVLGNLIDPLLDESPFRVQWSAIGIPTDFPTPLTLDAASKQAGAENLPSEYGAINFIANGERTGLILQERAITRFTYVGGNVVFQIDTYERTNGAFTPNGNIQIGNETYFISENGFHVTNGVGVADIGDKQVDQTFLSEVNFDERHKITVAADLKQSLIHWSFPTATVPDRVYTYNFKEKRWTNSDQTVSYLFSSVQEPTSIDDLDGQFASIDVVTPDLDSPVWKGGDRFIGAIGTDDKLGTFTGAALTATIDTQEVRLNPTGRSHVKSATPIIDGGTVSISAGARKTISDTPQFTRSVPANVRTGVAPLRSDDYYHRARVTISGGFNRAIGLEFEAVNSGDQ